MWGSRETNTGAFDFAQDRLFDYVCRKMRQTSLRMTTRTDND
jgi:hypothetical protein